jgi:hypothetical protein
MWERCARISSWPGCNSSSLARGRIHLDGLPSSERPRPLPGRGRSYIFVRGARQGGSVAERKAMIDRNHGLSISRQAKVLGISRSSVSYLSRGASDADLALMRRIDELHLEYPFAGSRMLKSLLKAEGHGVGRLHVSTLMKRMAIEALYRRPNTSKPAPGHKIYPYLLRNLAVTRPNQVWAMDITYVPMARGVRHRSRTGGDLMPHSTLRLLSAGSAARSLPGGFRLRCRRTVSHRGPGGGARPPRQTGDLQL